MPYPIDTPAWDDRLRREIRLFLQHSGCSQARLGELIGRSAGYIAKVLMPGGPVSAQFIDALDKHTFFNSIASEYHYIKLAVASSGKERERWRAKALECYFGRQSRAARLVADMYTELENEAKK